eukprot:525693_1
MSYHINKITRGRGRGSGRGRGGKICRGSGRTDTGQTTRKLGYGYIGSVSSISFPPSPVRYRRKTKSDNPDVIYTHNMQRINNDNVCYTISPFITTQSKYRKKKTHHIKLQPNEIRIMGDSVQEYVNHAEQLLFTHQYDIIKLIVYGRNISKLVSCAEILKRKIPGLRQVTEIKQVQLCDVWEPLEKRLKVVKVYNEVTQVEISLSDNKCNNLDATHIGYQSPIEWIDVSDAKEYVNKVNIMNEYKSNKMKKKLDEKYNNMKNELEHKFSILQKMYNKLQTERIDAHPKIKQQEWVISQLQNHKTAKVKKYESWTSKDIANFIVNIDTYKYNIYYENLLDGLINEGIDGQDLPELTRKDLYRLGIKQFKHKRDIFNAIKQLIDE